MSSQEQTGCYEELYKVDALLKRLHKLCKVAGKLSPSLAFQETVKENFQIIYKLYRYIQHHSDIYDFESPQYMSIVQNHQQLLSSCIAVLEQYAGFGYLKRAQNTMRSHILLTGVKIRLVDSMKALSKVPQARENSIFSKSLPKIPSVSFSSSKSSISLDDIKDLRRPSTRNSSEIDGIISSYVSSSKSQLELGKEIEKNANYKTII